MSNVVSLDAKRRQKQSQSPKPSEPRAEPEVDFQARLARIKSSINRINELMADLRRGEYNKK